MTLMRQRPMRRTEAPRDFLLRLFAIAQQFAAPREVVVAE